jgi:hypothetical protein
VNRSFLKREWGAVTFVLTVALGAIIVPIALILGNQAPAAAGITASPSPTVSAAASAPRTASPTP